MTAQLNAGTVGSPAAAGELPPLDPGATVAPGYAVVEHLSRGRVLDVYDVWSEARHARCIVKTLRPDHLDDRSASRHLAAEGRLMCRLSHPHLVRGYEVVPAAEDHGPVVVMEMLRGATLARLIDDAVSRFRVAEIAHLGTHLASGLAYLHRHGWLHLDVKPSNVVAEAGRAVLIDFSVARRPGRCPRGLGTWCYLAPEQALGQLVGPPADVWGLGGVLYEALTGEPPFDDRDRDEPTERDSDGHRVNYPQLLGPPVPVRRHRRVRGAECEVVDLVERCLAFEPERRPTLAEVLTALAPHAR